MTETKHKNIASALAAAQSQMGKALKDSKNPHFKSTYADLSSVVGACMPALNANGIAVIQPFHDDETGRFVKTIFVHGDSDQTMECRVPLIVNKNDMQGFGSAATYARRYGLMAMAGIAPEDDDGHAATQSPPKAEPKQPEPNTNDIADAKAAMLAANTVEALGAAYQSLPKPLRTNDQVKDLVAVRKLELTTAKPEDKPNDNADLGGDEIPM